jgi:glycosyltransferase involved in cell wall biosynthesis
MIDYYFNSPPVNEENVSKGGSEDGTDHPFTFAVVFDFRSHVERKNPFAPIRAFLDAFPLEDEHAFHYRLVVKAHSGKNHEVKKLKAIANEDPRINVINRILSDAENAAFHSRQDCYVSLHRSEGYGLNILESMGSGIPTITTNYSGNVDLYKAIPDSLIGKCHFPIPYKLVELERNYGPYTEGNHWAEPDHQHAVNAMRTVARNNCKKLHGVEMAKEVMDHYGAEVIGNQMKMLIEDAFPRIVKKQSEFVKRFQDEMHEILEQID